MNYRNHLISFFYLGLASFMLVFIAFACANPIAPTGGEKDESAPVMDSIRSTPNLQTNFEKQDLFFVFDEWVVIKDAFKQIIVSPPLATTLDVKPKGRGIIVRFSEDEELLENTTYTINFGSAIQDLNEGNPVENFKFVFSTGDIIDSLKIQGNIKDAITGEPQENILVLLYDQMKDSVFLSERPVYFAKTDENGNYEIENIREDTFMLRALADENLNYIFDLETERIGFLDSTIYITNDTLSVNYNIQLFSQDPVFRRTAKIDNELGVVKFAYNLPIENRIDSILTDLSEADWRIEKDSLYIWHQSDLSDSAFVIIVQDTLQDTFKIEASTEIKKRSLPTFKATPWSNSQEPLRRPSEPIIITTSMPLASIDTSFITILANDTLTQAIDKTFIDTVDDRRFKLLSNWQPQTKYIITLLPGALTDIFKQTNDTLAFLLSNAADEDFGNLILNAPGLDSSKQYVFNLLDNEKPLRTILIDNSTSWNFTFSNIPPKTYTVSFIEDINRNGRWDSGHYLHGIQPERILKQELEPLRASWDVEAEIKISW